MQYKWLVKYDGRVGRCAAPLDFDLAFANGRDRVFIFQLIFWLIRDRHDPGGSEYDTERGAGMLSCQGGTPATVFGQLAWVVCGLELACGESNK